MQKEFKDLDHLGCLREVSELLNKSRKGIETVL